MKKKILLVFLGFLAGFAAAAILYFVFDHDKTSYHGALIIGGIVTGSAFIQEGPARFMLGWILGGIAGILGWLTFIKLI